MKRRPPRVSPGAAPTAFGDELDASEQAERPVGETPEFSDEDSRQENIGDEIVAEAGGESAVEEDFSEDDTEPGDLLVADFPEGSQAEKSDDEIAEFLAQAKASDAEISDGESAEVVAVDSPADAEASETAAADAGAFGAEAADIEAFDSGAADAGAADAGAFETEAAGSLDPQGQLGVDLFDEVDEESIAEVLSIWTGVPVYKLTEEETTRLLRMEDELHKRVIGQNEAIHATSQAIRRTRAGLKDPKRPSGSFIFLGPSGVGKTELAKTLAEFLFGDEQALISLDMSEYQEKHTVSRLVGSPPGYVGYEEGGQLTTAVRNRPFSVVLFDEIEKAHPDVFNTLLQVLEEGRLTDSHGRSVDFRNTVLIMTSNEGTQDLRKASLGFAREDGVVTYERMKEKVNEALKVRFRPEFLNRIDEIVVFHELSQEDVLQIVDLMTQRIVEQLRHQGIGFELSHEAKVFLSERGYDRTLGARPLRRAIQRYMEDPLSERLLNKDFRAGEIVLVDVEEDPDNPGEQRVTFRSMEGYVAPDVVEEMLAIT